MVRQAVRGLDERWQHDLLVGQISGAEDLGDHVPVEAIAEGHSLPVLVLTAEQGPELFADGAVDGPGVLAQQELHLALLVLLQQALHVGERLQRGLLRRRAVHGDRDARAVHVGGKHLVCFGLLFDSRQHRGHCERLGH